MSLASSIDAGNARNGKFATGNVFGFGSVDIGNARSDKLDAGNSFGFSVAPFDATFGIGADTLEMGAVLTLADVEAFNGLGGALTFERPVAGFGRCFLTGGLEIVVAVVLDAVGMGAPAAI